MEQIIQIFGAMLVLVAYVLSQMRKLATDSLVYLVLNFVGACILGVLAFRGQQWGFLLLEVVWGVVTLGSLLAALRRPRPISENS